MTETEYRQLPAINATAIKAGAHSMARMHAVMTGKGKQANATMILGSLVHELLHNNLSDRWAKYDGTTRRGKAYDEFCLANAGKTVVTQDELTEACDLANMALAKPAIRRILAGNVEPVYEWETVPYGRAKARLDVVANDGSYAVEVKTMRDISDRGFARSFYDMGYDLQLGWYDKAVGNDSLVWWVVAIQTGENPDARLIKIPRFVVREGYIKAREIAIRYRACETTGIYHGIDNGEEFTEFQPPIWAMNDEITTTEEITL